MMTESQNTNIVNASITITVYSEFRGLLVSMQTEGDFSDEMMSRRFYSIADVPPPELTSAEFWGPILGQISGFLENPS